MNIFLTGMMGCGKSTIGRKLALRLGYYFLDTDQAVEDKAHCSIPDIFKYLGEEKFRDMETQVLNQISSLNNTVIATGGGIILREKNRLLMEKAGTVIYLKTSEEVLLQRLQRDQSRPLLQKGASNEKTLQNLMQKRAPLYEQATHIIGLESHTPQKVITKIINSL